MKISRLSAAPLLLALAMPAAPAVAQRELFPRFSARVGSYILTSSTKLTLDAAAGGPGQEVDFERDLGLDSSQTLATIWLEWQATEHHLFRFGYFDLSHQGSRSLGRTFTWGGVTYPVGAEGSAKVSQTNYELDWTWWFVRRAHWAFGSELGVTDIQFDVRASATAHVGTNVVSVSRSASASAPVPTLGIAARFQPLSQLWLEVEARILPGVNIGNVDGDAVDFVAAAEWQAARHFNLGVNWTKFGIDANLDSKTYKGRANLTTSGFTLYARFPF